jgi:hypothetical protein
VLVPLLVAVAVLPVLSLPPAPTLAITTPPVLVRRLFLPQPAQPRRACVH